MAITKDLYGVKGLDLNCSTLRVSYNGKDVGDSGDFYRKIKTYTLIASGKATPKEITKLILKGKLK